MDIISKVNKNDFKASADFRTSFNAYYRVRQRKSEWYDAYYELMENQKHYPLSFEQLLRKHSASCVFFPPLFLPTFVASL